MKDCKRDFEETLQRLKGQPVQIITQGGFKFCGIVCEVDCDSVMIIDNKSRIIRISLDHIVAVIEPQKELDRLCKDNNCGCDRDRDCDCDDDKRNGRDHRDDKWNI